MGLLEDVRRKKRIKQYEQQYRQILADERQRQRQQAGMGLMPLIQACAAGGQQMPSRE